MSVKSGIIYHIKWSFCVLSAAETYKTRDKQLLHVSWISRPLILLWKITLTANYIKITHYIKIVLFMVHAFIIILSKYIINLYVAFTINTERHQMPLWLQINQNIYFFLTLFRCFSQNAPFSIINEDTYFNIVIKLSADDAFL